MQSGRPILLGVNIDHAATLRQARYRGTHLSIHAEPSPLAFAREAMAAGADGITIHLREDRRHIQPEDVFAIAALPGVRLNLEMACTPAMIEFAQKLKPAAVCLVPESREEVTTEGGLDVAGQLSRVSETVKMLSAIGSEVSLFIGAEAHQLEAAKKTKAPVVEIHTGAFANAWQSPQAAEELERLKQGCERAHQLGFIVNAGHGINYDNIKAILALPHLNELNIGHTIVSRALMVGARQAVAEMKAHLRAAR
jgi:pyridoxine 5-phosphate synthase